MARKKTFEDIVASKPYPPVIKNFIQFTRADHPRIRQTMGGLAEQGIDPKDFEKFCKAFADGLQYAYVLHNTKPQQIMLDDNENYIACYYEKFDDDTLSLQHNRVALSRVELAKLIKSSPYIQLSKPGFPRICASPYDFIRIAGVEEGLHCWQYSSSPLSESYKYNAMHTTALQSVNNPNADPQAYASAPIESDIEWRLLEALDRIKAGNCRKNSPASTPGRQA